MKKLVEQIQVGKLDSPSIEQVLGPARHREELCKDGGGRGQRRPGDQGAPTRTVGMRGLQAAVRAWSPHLPAEPGGWRCAFQLGFID